jgi:succinoglycan biosynthesis protein ExoA
MNYGEDDELNWRLLQGGHRIYIDTRIRFHYITRPSWKGAYRQYRNYGFARVGVVAKHPSFLRIHHLVPAVFVGGLGGLAGLGVVSRRARRLLAAAVGGYVFGCSAEAARVSGPADPALAARVASAFPALHVGYGVGMLKGLAAALRG